MPAQSKQQQKFMGLVHAIQKGDVPASNATPQAQKVAKDMKPSDVKDFASTKHTGLPKKVKQEILKKLKEYAYKVNHQKQVAAPKEPLRPDYEMDLQKESRIPTNFNVGTTRDYHTKLATTPREKYDKTNFNTAHSGQEDLEEAQAVSGGKVHKFITGKNLGFKGKKYTEIEFETLGVDNKNGTIRVKILAPREIFGNEMSLDFRSVRRGPYFKTDTSKVNEISADTIHKLADKKGIKWDNEPSFLKLTKQLTGKEHLDGLTPRELIKVQQYLEKQSIKESCDKALSGESEDSFRTRCFGYNATIPPPKGMINNQIQKKNKIKEYAQSLDFHFILNKDAKLAGTPEPKKAIGEELDFDEREMVIGIIEILKQVQDPKNRMRIALNMLKKFKEEGIEFDYQKFMNHLKEYTMGSYEYDKGNRELGEAMIKSMKDVVTKLLPTNTLARHADTPSRNKEFVEKIVKELGTLLNRFYKQNDINLVLK